MSNPLTGATQKDLHDAAAKQFPIMLKRGERPHPTRIPWSVAELAYSVYAAENGTGQSLQRLAERGGFSVYEMDEYLPEWEARCDVLQSLTARIAELEEINHTLAVQKVCWDRERAELEGELGRQEFVKENGDLRARVKELESAQTIPYTADGAPCTLGKCRPGLLAVNGSLYFKTPPFQWLNHCSILYGLPDVMITKAFDDLEDRDSLIVQPVKLAAPPYSSDTATLVDLITDMYAWGKAYYTSHAAHAASPSPAKASDTAPS